MSSFALFGGLGRAAWQRSQGKEQLTLEMTAFKAIMRATLQIGAGSPTPFISRWGNLLSLNLATVTYEITPPEGDRGDVVLCCAARS